MGTKMAPQSPRVQAEPYLPQVAPAPQEATARARLLSVKMQVWATLGSSLETRALKITKSCVPRSRTREREA